MSDCSDCQHNDGAVYNQSCAECEDYSKWESKMCNHNCQQGRTCDCVPRKHRDLIIAWANGARIELRLANGLWERVTNPLWQEQNEYRIKPEPKPDKVAYSRVYGVFEFSCEGIELQQIILRPGEVHANIKYTFDGETGKLKSAEVLE